MCSFAGVASHFLSETMSLGGAVSAVDATQGCGVLGGTAPISLALKYLNYKNPGKKALETLKPVMWIVSNLGPRGHRSH